MAGWIGINISQKKLKYQSHGGMALEYNFNQGNFTSEDCEPYRPSGYWCYYFYYTKYGNETLSNNLSPRGIGRKGNKIVINMNNSNSKNASVLSYQPTNVFNRSGTTGSLFIKGNLLAYQINSTQAAVVNTHYLSSSGGGMVYPGGTPGDPTTPPYEDPVCDACYYTPNVCGLCVDIDQCASC